MIPDESIEHLSRGYELLQKSFSERDEEGKLKLARQAGAECALAIKKADGKFANAHALLGVVHRVLNDRKRAFDEYNIATSLDPHNLHASMGRLEYYQWDYERAWQFYLKVANQGRDYKARAIKEELTPTASQYQTELKHMVECYLTEFEED